jgi:hypothetical protein
LTPTEEKNAKTHLASHQVHDLESVLHDADGKNLLAVVATVHHERVADALNNGALSLAEALGLVATSRVGVEHGEAVLHGNVVLKGDVADLDVIERPLLEKLDVNGRGLNHGLLNGDGNLGHSYFYWLIDREVGGKSCEFKKMSGRRFEGNEGSRKSLILSHCVVWRPFGRV